MTERDRINASDYRLPILDVPMATALATALMSATPEKAPDNVGEALGEVRKALEALGRLQQEKRATGPGTQDPRPVDVLVDNAWSSLHGSLTSLASLPADLYPRAAEASSLVSAIFGDKRPLAFLQLRYPAEWAEVKAHIELIESQKLEPRIKALVGPEFMAEIRRTFEMYGAVLGITEPPPAAAPTDSLLAALRDLNAAINDYVIAVLGMARRSKPGSRAAVEQALEAISRLRRTGSPTPTQPDAVDPTPPAQGETSKPQSLSTPEGKSRPS